MEGLKYITDEKGNKKALIISLDEYADFIEDIEDILISYKRQSEKRVPIDQVKENIKNYRNLDV